MERPLLFSLTMSRVGSALLIALLALPLLGQGEAQAYDAHYTHRWIARKAAELLVATYPGEYDEVLEYTEEIVDGAFHEDDFFLDGDDDPTTLRVMRHFYRAPDGLGLEFGSARFPSSYEWHGQDTEQNEWNYFDGMRAYQAGNLGQAYFIAGHTVHLISDLTVPAHAHLDDHGPPYGDDYENHCRSRMTSDLQGSLRQPPAGATIPDFANLAEAFKKTANTSYYRNLYPGNLNGDVPGGVVSQMFPNIKKGLLSGVWEIEGLGKLGTAFYEEEAGYYYFSRNAAPSKYDVINYNPAKPFDRQYGPISSEAPMVERMADDLIPVAILHSAGVLKLFIDEARALPSLPDTEEPPILDDGQPGGCNTSSSTGMSWLAALFALALLGRFSARFKKTRA